MDQAPQFVEKIKSKTDNTVKYIFRSCGQVIEFSYINKNDGKDIICAPTQTGCRLGCAFCYLTDYDLAVRNLAPDEISLCVDYIVEDLGLLECETPNGVLLISFMGCGEPLCNLPNLIESCNRIREAYRTQYRVVRFAVASLIPSGRLMERFIRLVAEHGLLVKFHLSLHSALKKTRRALMPSAHDILESVLLVQKYMQTTGNSTEIHYALISGVNDGFQDLSALIRLLRDRHIPVKFLVYNKKPSIPFVPSANVVLFRTALEEAGIATEFYDPPGSDIGSSCGQFLMDYYEKYNIRS